MWFFDGIRAVIAGGPNIDARIMQIMMLKKGLALDNAGLHEKAIKYYEAILAEAPGHALAWGFKGAALVKIEKLSAAKEAFHNFIKFSAPEHAKLVEETRETIRKIDMTLRNKNASPPISAMFN